MTSYLIFTIMKYQNASVTLHVMCDEINIQIGRAVEALPNGQTCTRHKHIAISLASLYQIRVSRSKSELPSRPMHALRNVSSALRWRESEFTTSVPVRIHMSTNQRAGIDKKGQHVPGFTRGAFSIYESKLSTG